MCKAFTNNALLISGIYSRNTKEGKSLAKKTKVNYYNTLTSLPIDADVYLICVSDDAIKDVVNQLPKSIKKSKIIAHTSGSKSIQKTLIKCKYGGVFYPLQTFTKGKKLRYRNIPICITASHEKTLNTLITLAKRISNSVHRITDGQRKQIHLSAVMTNNFINHLIYASQDLLDQNNIDSKILLPLLQETIRKQKSLGAYDAQTGPARRLDEKTLTTHLDMLISNEEYQAIYKAISKSIHKTYNKKQ
jgi:predicted short-subunit dehydrogenase-like oxidoreductase (DUF2520 family)